MSRANSHALFSWPTKGELDGVGADEITEGLFLCGEEPGANRDFAKMIGARVVICCNAQPSHDQYLEYDARNGASQPIATHDAFVEQIRRTGRREPDGDHTTLVMNIAADDSPAFDLSPWFPRSCEVLEAVEAVAARAIVHCMAGVSRSATIVAARIMQRTNLGCSQVVGYMRERRRIVNPNPGFVNQLHRWDLTGHQAIDHADPGAVDRAADRIAQNSIDKFRGYVSAMMTSAHLIADRNMVGPLIVALSRRAHLTVEDGVEQIMSIAIDQLDSDEAVDSPHLPANIVRMLGSVHQAAGVGAVTAQHMEHIASSVVSGMGDAFGFCPEATASLLQACAAEVSLPAFHWVHLVAARLRGILDTCSPLAFPPSLKPNFAFLTEGADPSDVDPDYFDAWEPNVSRPSRLAVLSYCVGRIVAMAALGDLAASPVFREAAEVIAACRVDGAFEEGSAVVAASLAVMGVAPPMAASRYAAELEQATTVLNRCS